MDKKNYYEWNYGMQMLAEGNISNLKDWSDKKEAMGRIIDYVFDYVWQICNDGYVIINSRLLPQKNKKDIFIESGSLIPHLSFKRCNRDFEGHFEYASLDDLLLDWLPTLYEATATNFAKDIRFILTMNGDRISKPDAERLEKYETQIGNAKTIDELIMDKRKDAPLEDTARTKKEISEFLNTTEGHPGTYTIGFCDDCGARYYIHETDIEAVRAALLMDGENVYDLALSDGARHVINRHVQPDSLPVAKIIEIEFHFKPTVWKR